MSNWSEQKELLLLVFNCFSVMKWKTQIVVAKKYFSFSIETYSVNQSHFAERTQTILTLTWNHLNIQLSYNLTD